MTAREKLGLGILVGLFFIFGLVLFWTIRPRSEPTRDIRNNVLIEQRMINLQKENK